jgi:hypothetical protein
LKVDTNLTDKSFQVKAYGSKPLGLGDKTLASEFIEMPTEVQFSEAEKIAGASALHWKGGVVLSITSPTSCRSPQLDRLKAAERHRLVAELHR